MEQEKIGKFIAKRRKDLHFTQANLAKKLGITDRAVSKWENDVAEPGVKDLRTLSRLYGVTLDQLMETEEAPPQGTSSSLEYLIWTGAMAVVTVVLGIFTWTNYETLTIPIALIAMLVGIWVRYPAMWVVIQCLMGLGALLLMPYVLLTENVAALDASPFSLAMFLVVGIVHTGFAYVFYFGSMQSLKAQTIALFSYLDPIFAILLSAVVLGEPLGMTSIIGAVLVLGSTLVSELKA